MLDPSCIVIKDISRDVFNYISRNTTNFSLDVLDKDLQSDLYEIRLGEYDIMKIDQLNRHGDPETRVTLGKHIQGSTGYTEEQFLLKKDDFFKMEVM